MPAIIEREAVPGIARREAVIAAVTTDTPRPRKAPLATLVVLMASARASAQAVEEAGTCDGESA